MGCIPSKSATLIPQDVIDLMSNEERIEYLCHGYLRLLELDQNTTTEIFIFSCDVKYLCSLYLGEIRIESPTEIKIKGNKILEELAVMNVPRPQIVMLTCGRVGQSCMVTRFAMNIFYEDGGGFIPTLEANYARTIVIDDKKVELEILDTCTMSPPRFRSEIESQNLRIPWIKQGQAFIVTYAVHKRKIFQAIQPLYGLINDIKLKQQYLEDTDIFDGDKYPAIILVGNQIDRPRSEREVSINEGRELAMEWGVSYYEVSAKTGENIEELFVSAAKLAMDVGSKVNRYISKKIN